MAQERTTKWIGKTYQRKQDPRFLTGRGRYTDDVELPGMLYAAILRSPYAHARIKGLNTDAAAKLPGVVTVLSGAQAAKLSHPLPPTINLAGMKLNTSYAVAVDKVRYVGEPVAAVAAVDRYVAEDALELIEVEYEPLPVVTTTAQALAKDAPLLYEEWGNNIELEWHFDTGDVEKAFSEAGYVFEDQFSHHRYTGTPLEGRAALADYSALSGELTVYMSTQIPHQARTLLSQVLGVPEQKIRVIAPAVGGGFGNKIQIDAEMIPCLLSMVAGRPVKWTETRSENLLSCVHSRDYLCHLKVGVQKDGRILGIKAKLIGNVGCDGTNRAAGIGALLVAAFYLPGPYKITNYAIDVLGVVTNKAPYGAYRGYGKDMANYPIERMLNLIARRLGLSPREVREKNFIPPEEFPYTQCTGPLYDSGNYPECLRKLMEMIGYENLLREQAQLRQEGRYMGIGFSFMLEPSGGAVPNCIFNGYETATVRMTPEGGITLLTGIQDIGQGVETTFAQVVADELQVNPEDVKVIFGDTESVPYGLGSWSSRGAAYGASSALAATRRVKEKALKVAAHLLKVQVKDLNLEDGRIFNRGDPEKSLSLREIARQVYLWPGPYLTVPEGEEPTLEATVCWTSPIVRWVPDASGTLSIYTTHPNGAFAAVVEVDVETGRIDLRRFAVVHDAGVLINPMIVNGQIHGGVAQGIGGVLLEELKYDDNGQLLTTTFQDYLIPTAPDLPDIEVDHIVSASPFTATGAKGMGEGGAVGSPAAVVNAVEDALAPFGVVIRDTPLTPERILRLIREARRE